MIMPRSIDGEETNVLHDLLIGGLESASDGLESADRPGRRSGHCRVARQPATSRATRMPPERRGSDPVHVHEDVQICLSLNFPGRYRSGRWTCDVPAGALSVVDAWEPHGAEDPCDRSAEARYWLLCPPERWGALAADIGAAPRTGIHVSTDAADAQAFAALHRRSRDGADALEPRSASWRFSLPAPRHEPEARPVSLSTPASAWKVTGDMVDRARDYVHARALDRVTLAEVARECGASPQHSRPASAPVSRARASLPDAAAARPCAGSSLAARRQARRQRPAV
jgi:hypothetical protein